MKNSLRRKKSKWADRAESALSRRMAVLGHAAALGCGLWFDSLAEIGSRGPLFKKK